MKKIGLLQAGEHLATIADEVNRTGEPITLTRDGEPFVDIIPHNSGTRSGDTVQTDVVAKLEAIRQGLPRNSTGQAKSEISEGRR